MNQHEEHAKNHKEHHVKIISAVTEASKSEDIATLRVAFKKISDELIAAVENQGYKGKLFKQYCPMYKGGSSWLSKEKKVQNPFFGQSMHSCGDIVEEID
jgi:Cu(I)/Ag(I) efflux system membrane fusion protein